MEVVDVLFMYCIYSQLEGALSHWTSYQEDVSQFECWMERVEESLGNSDKHYAEMRDKTANLGRAKANYTFHRIYLAQRITILWLYYILTYNII